MSVEDVIRHTPKFGRPPLVFDAINPKGKLTIKPPSPSAQGEVTLETEAGKSRLAHLITTDGEYLYIEPDFTGEGIPTVQEIFESIEIHWTPCRDAGWKEPRAVAIALLTEHHRDFRWKLDDDRVVCANVYSWEVDGSIELIMSPFWGVSTFRAVLRLNEAIVMRAESDSPHGAVTLLRERWRLAAKAAEALEKFEGVNV